MEFLTFRPERDQLVYTFGGAPPLARIAPGTALKLWSDDAFSGALSSVDDLESEKVDPDLLNPQTGPFYIEGAEPGDTLAVHVVDLVPARSWGASRAIQFVGSMDIDRTELVRRTLLEATWIYDVDLDAGTVGFSARYGDFDVALPLAPMLGTVGVAPAGGEVRSSLVPERFGGNMDTPELRAGSTLYLRVNVEGAMFSLGDGHYRQGEGEACGTAVEGAMESTVIVELIKGAGPAWPRLETDEYFMVVGSARPLEDSWRFAQAEMIAWLGELYGLHEMDAYQLLTQISESPIANVVDPNFSVVTKIRKSLLPPVTAYDGIHDELRSRARGLR